jgi:ATP-dependent Lon protease
MSKDKQPKISKKSSSTKKKEEAARLKKRKDESSDSDFVSDDEESIDEEMDMQEYREFLAKTFPSKHLDKKVNAGKKLKEVLEEETEPDKKDKKNPLRKKKIIEDESDEDDDDEEYIPKKSNNKKEIKKPINKKKIVEEESEDDESDDSDEDISDDEPEVKGKTGKFNIIFTIGAGKNQFDDEFDEDDDDDDDWLTCSEENVTENEDDPVSSDDDTEEEEDDNDDDDEPVIKKKKNVAKKTIVKEPKEVKVEDNTNKSIEKQPVESDNVLSILKELQTKNKDTDLINECIKVCEEKIKVNKKKQEKKITKQKERNDRIFKRILRDKNTMNDFDFFEKLELEQQKKIIKELREINKITRVEKPYRLTLLEADIPLIFKSAALKKISSLRYMEPGSGEFYKIKNWVDTFMRIPFGKYNNLPISIDDGVEKCHDFMAVAQKTLDDAVYGLNDAKMQIMQLLGQLITNPKAIGTAIAIHGPAGTGKTSIVKEGISKILNRPFAFIALGGATDSSFLEGHGYTYEGSTWGKIVQILIDSKCMNPVIYFDELDKISDTPKGEEITGILTHLTDTSQNSQFHDKYFSEIDFDLSKCLFIFSYNDESKVNPILKDRMYRIQTKGYNQKQKTVITNNHLLPKIREQVRFKVEDIIIPDETIHYMIDNFCNKEDGVRNLKRCLEIIYTKLNLYRLMRPGSNLFEEDMALKVEFPFKVTKDIVDKLIKTNKENVTALHSLYI